MYNCHGHSILTTVVFSMYVDYSRIDCFQCIDMDMRCGRKCGSLRHE